MENKRQGKSFFSQKNSSTDRRESTGNEERGSKAHTQSGGAAREGDPRESKDRSHSGERKSYNRDDRKPFSPRGNDDRKPFAGKRDDDRKPFSPRGNDDRKPFAGKRDDDRKPFSPRGNDDRKPFAGKRDDDRKPFSPRGSDDRKPFSPRGNDDRKPFSPRGNDDKKSSYAKREEARPERVYADNERKPRHLRTSDKPKERDPFSRQTFNGDSANYSERLDKDRKPKKSAIKPRGAAPIKIINPNEPLRLNRFISQSGVCSRREADDLIKSGDVTVNGVVITELGVRVERTDVVEFQGKQLRGEKKVYIIMNKPKGYITSVDDPHNDRTIMDLLKGEVQQRVYPVGRLDKYTTGVILLTNDGDLTKELTHPSYEKSKIYHVFIDKAITEADLQQLLEGVTLEDGEIHADEISTVGGSRKEVGIELHSGRNRIVRRMFEHLGYEVERLDRVYFAGLTKVGLRRGFWRYLTEAEVGTLKSKNYR